MKSEAKIEQQRVRNESYRESLRKWFTERRWLKVWPILANGDKDSLSLRVLEFLTDAKFVDACAR